MPLHYFGTVAGNAGYGSNDAIGSAASFHYPIGIWGGGAGVLYVADWANSTIRRVTPGGAVTTFAGSAGRTGIADGTGSDARFNGPTSVVLDPNGNVYVADRSNHTIRRITPAGEVTTAAGRAGTAGTADGPAALARFRNPTGLAIDYQGSVYITDGDNHTIRRLSPDGIVTTLAGLAGNAGSVDGTGAGARFNYPNSIAADLAGNLYVSDAGTTIRKITPEGTVTTLAGTAGASGSANGIGAAARFSSPHGLVADNAGSLYVADYGNHTIRHVTADGVVTTFAGLAGAPGAADGNRDAARFNNPAGITVGAGGVISVADTENCTIRKIIPSGAVSTLAGLAGSVGSADGAKAVARFHDPGGVAVDGTRCIYVADSANHTIRRIAADGSVTTLAGSAGVPGSVDGIGTAALFRYPKGLAIDSSHNLYVADSANGSVRKVTPEGAVQTLVSGLSATQGTAVTAGGDVVVTDGHSVRMIAAAGTVTTLAGVPGTSGSADGIGAAARFNAPAGIAIDSSGNAYVADQNNHTIRKVTRQGVVTTISGLAGVSGNTDGIGSAARFCKPSGVTLDAAGNLYVVDKCNHSIRLITAVGAVSTVAGFNASSADGIGANARFRFPYGTALDTAGVLYVTDSGNNTIRFGSAAVSLTPLNAASRKRHGSAGELDVDLPLVAAPAGIEPRSGGGSHAIVVRFSTPVVSGDVAITEGRASIGIISFPTPYTVAVPLTGLLEGERLTLEVNNVTDVFGQVWAHTALQVAFLTGDTNGDGVVNSGDAIQTRSRAGQTSDEANFRCDVNADGVINAGDALVVRSRSGASLP